MIGIGYKSQRREVHVEVIVVVIEAINEDVTLSNVLERRCSTMVHAYIYYLFKKKKRMKLNNIHKTISFVKTLI
jgi:hypothetical protein